MLLGFACAAAAFIVIGKVASLDDVSPENYVRSCLEACEKDLKFYSVYVSNDNAKNIYIIVENKSTYLSQEVLYSAYTALYEKFFENPESPYVNNTLTLQFQDVSKCPTCLIENISKDNSNLTFKAYTLFNMEYISSVMPKITNLYWLTTVGFEDVEKIAGFNELTYFVCATKLTDDECGYIRSLYPDCEICYYNNGVIASMADAQISG